MRKLVALLRFAYLKDRQERKLAFCSSFLPRGRGNGSGLWPGAGPGFLPQHGGVGKSLWGKAIPEPKAAEKTAMSWDCTAKISSEAAAAPHGASRGQRSPSAASTAHTKPKRTSYVANKATFSSKSERKKSKSREGEEHGDSKVRKKGKVKSHGTTLKWWQKKRMEAFPVLELKILLASGAEAIKISCTWRLNQRQTTTHPQKVCDGPGDLEFTKIIRSLHKIFIWTICLHCSSEWTDSLVFRNLGEATKNHTDLLQGMLFLKTPSALNITLLFEGLLSPKILGTTL
ncbi:uncharacterized protein LOC125317254 [Corvus hawaiiensis]|uniref:uncharacterized protein LOC125317254 n=1 Tax=Corvus hawaiiensis TaxID=134902 RepID=UPI0020194DF7|nr:uncharacterized protein LOC125317254 [Corvus hawaiiensis]